MYGVEINDLEVKIGNFKLNDINISIPKGTIFGLVGRNGAGKTTLIKAIANALNKTSGEILLNGYNVVDNEIDYINQLSVSYDHLNVRSQFKPKRIIKILKTTYKNFDEEFMLSNMTKFNIDMNKRLVNNSYGQNKKFSLILAMSLNPEILILDEPTAGIDPLDKILLIEMLQSFIEDESKTLIYSTHIISDLEKIADYIALIDNGNIKFVKEKDHLLEESYLIRLDRNELNKELEASLIGMKEWSLGIVAICKNKALLDKYKIKYVKPNMEDILIHYLEQYKGGEVKWKH